MNKEMTDLREPTPKQKLLPSDNQIREFWEWCGFRSNAMKLSEGGWDYPNGGWDIRLPKLDLNNLFKWAVPKLESIQLAKYADTQWHAQVQYKGILREATSDTDYALALFWAIQMVKEAQNAR